ncbi:hypothetical protein AGOR_G00167520 [Albula goreensis]|uniref:Apple domain-containing protein n=1 Tax=Albula goreensis TaxID=1534307 RepID=A0A8T3D585_9TELE|nr:hypothetical protein AGOR_G00167520 [Albula goreensis]
MAQCTLLAATLALLLLVMPCLFSHVEESPRIIASQTMENNTICASACAVSKLCNWPVFDTKNKMCHFIKCPVNTVCQNITVEELLRNEETDIQPDSGDLFMFPNSSVPNISLDMEVFPVNSSFLTSSNSDLNNTDTIFDEAMENSTFSMTSASDRDVSTVAPSDHAHNQEPTAQNDSPAFDSYKKRDYTQVDYLINGMYSDSGV